MAKGRIEKDDLIKRDALQTFQELQKVVEANIVTIEKLKRATLQLDRVKGSDKEIRAKRKVLRYQQEYLSNQRKVSALNKKHIAQQRQLSLEIKKTTKTQSGFMRNLSMGLRNVVVPLLAIQSIFKGIGDLKNTLIRLDSFRFALNKITGSAAATTESMN